MSDAPARPLPDPDDPEACRAWAATRTAELERMLDDCRAEVRRELAAGRPLTSGAVILLGPAPVPWRGGPTLLRVQTPIGGGCYTLLGLLDHVKDAVLGRMESESDARDAETDPRPPP